MVCAPLSESFKERQGCSKGVSLPRKARQNYDGRIAFIEKLEDTATRSLCNHHPCSRWNVHINILRALTSGPTLIHL